jgi:chemotaxis protein histidine kinase CheA
MVAERYQEASGETLLRDGPDLRRHFIQKLCNRGIKPTGNSGEKNGATKRAQEIYESILVKESVANFGANDDDDEDDFEEGDEEEEDQEDDMRARIQAEFDLTAEEPDVEQSTSSKRKTNPIVAEKSKNSKNKKKSDSKRANLAKTMDNVMTSMQESAQTRMMMTMMQMQQDNQAKMQAQLQAQMQTQMQAQMQMMQTMMMALTRQISGRDLNDNDTVFHLQRKLFRVRPLHPLLNFDDTL